MSPRAFAALGVSIWLGWAAGVAAQAPAEPAVPAGAAAEEASGDLAAPVVQVSRLQRAPRVPASGRDPVVLEWTAESGRWQAPAGEGAASDAKRDRRLEWMVDENAAAVVLVAKKKIRLEGDAPVDLDRGQAIRLAVADDASGVARVRLEVRDSVDDDWASRRRTVMLESADREGNAQLFRVGVAREEKKKR